MKRSSLPDIKIELTNFDKLLEGAAFIGMLATLIIPIIYWNSLPQKMPMHFNAAGEPDAFGEKIYVWILPAVSLFTYLLMTFINKNPKNFNYPVKITPSNAESKYRNALMMNRWLKAIIMFLLAYMIFMGIQVGLGNSVGMGNYFVYVFIAIVCAPIAYYGFLKK